MVMLHGLLAGRVATRASQDVDVLADPLTDEAGLARCVRAVRELDLEPQPDAAWATDARDRERHSGDAAFLAGLIADPLAERDRFAGSDRKRLQRLDEVLGDPAAAEWRRLGEAADDGYATWRLLLG
ncbi:hypothetical protein ACI792_11790 [Blastococcus sp. SYSU DS0669]